MLARHLLNAGRLQLRRNNFQPLPRIAPIRFMSSNSPFVDGGRHATMNDLPVPEGDWKDWYARRNTKHSIVMVVGILSMVTALYMHLTDESVCYNYKVPEYDRC